MKGTRIRQWPPQPQKTSRSCRTYLPSTPVNGFRAGDGTDSHGFDFDLQHTSMGDDGTVRAVPTI
eukprot:2669591-Prymnesium_polylepis.1